jgi:hypothetical protein
MVFSLMSVFAIPAEGQPANPDTECGTNDNDLWNGEYWKIQIDEGEVVFDEESPESNVGDDAIDFELDGLTVTWTNEHDNAVFRIVRKSGQTESDDIEGHWPTGEGGTFEVPSDISHVTFCFTDEVPPEPGQIIVEKVVSSGDTAQSFEFTASYDEDGFSLADSESNNSGDLDPGNYSVEETVPAGWTLDSATCDNEDDPSSIDLEAGQTVTCTFTNSEDEVPPEPGQIIVEKVVTEGSDTSQSFEFTASYDEDGFSLADGESNNSGDLDAGTYSVAETVPTGWSLVSAVCDNEDDPSSIDLEAGETVTCTFTNDELPEEVEPGEIIVQKVVLSGSQTFQFTFGTVGFTLADNTLAHGQSSSSGDIAPGDGYSVTETLPPGWTMVSAVCDDGSPVTNIDVEAGETVTCTFTNTIEDVVQASILVQVTGTCVETDGEGEGLITVSMSVAGGAEVVIRNSSGAVVGTLSADGSITVPEGATYTWEATANEGFEFPEDADTSGSITIETCSDPETLPFTGIDLDLMAAYAAALLAGGLAMLLFSRRAEES